MNTNHLTETELQEWLTREVILSEEGQEHLADCPLCKSRLSSYRAVITAMQKEVMIETNPLLADKLMNRILTEEKAAAKSQYTGWWYVLILIVGFIALVVLTGKGLLYNFKSFSDYFFNKGTLQGLAWMILAGIVLVIVQFLDLKLHNPLQHSKLFSGSATK